ncbi:metallopeptidase MepB [Akanthomyces lecanii RCEF 1005]|uniref:Metallopeptidase MepB n=1 Tax=Akanthomyces lecanii RCEF 1005 TaxID=1081108 RepID=A0A168IR32_CORDF|nr:metallopeptidase MepB [Akanthomyces lecanii RCEF 1005]
MSEASWNSSDEMYELLQAARDNDENLDTASKLLLDKTLLEYKLAGCGAITKDEKDAFAKESLELENLLAKAKRNIAQESGGIWLADQDLQDLPAEELNRIKKQRNPDDTPPNEGMTFVLFSNGGTTAILTFSDNPDVRKKMYLADQKKLQHNLPLLQEIVKRRQNLAQRLRYKNHAERRMETRLLKGPAQVQELLDSLTSGLVKRGRRELEQLQEARFEDLHQLGRSRDAILQNGFPPWDEKYYRRRISRRHQVDESAVSEYFPLEFVTPAMLQVFQAVLGLRFNRIPESEAKNGKIWHDTVTVFAVWDTRQSEPEFVGYIYFDLLWRENKFRGAHNVTMDFGYGKSNGGRKYPSTIVMSSFPTADDEHLVLLNHNQLITIFHELGHAIHSLVSRTKYAKFHGTSLPPDFVEMPSLMLENWCWIPEVLKPMSTHYSHLRPEYRDKWQPAHPHAEQPPKQLPDEIADALVKHRYSGRGLYHLYQLSISLFDLAIHSPCSAEEVDALDVRELCCSSFAQDLFQSLFAADPANVDAWERYRRTILEPGAEHPDLLRLLEEGLGHRPDATALVKVLENASL